jgi:NTE family protein
MKIGLALSVGGALGAAHISVLEELEKHSIKIDEVSGTSSGSLIAAIYATGGLDQVNQFFAEISKLDFFSHKKPFRVTTPAKFFDLVFQVVGKYCTEKIEKTPLKLSIIATDLVSGEPVVFQRGNTIDALKASCAYPGVFPVQKLNDHLYIDGGTTWNLPARFIAKNVDFLIGSDLYPIDSLDREKASKMNRAAILLRTFDIIQKELANFAARECDFCFKMELGVLKWYSFNKVDSIKREGRAQAKKQIKQLVSLLNP